MAGSVRLSKTQEEVVTLMREGWELGQTSGWDHRAWLQKDGIGKGGPTKRVSSSTFHALWKKKVIVEKKRGYPTTTYRLDSFMEKWERIIKSKAFDKDKEKP